MADRIETVSTSDGPMDVFIAHPDGPGGPWPVIVQLMDGIGMREELRDHARRVAGWGYYVMAPDLYHRFDFKVPADFSDPEQAKHIMSAIQTLTGQLVTSDVEAALEIASGDAAARDGKIGLHGYCMGGKLTLDLAETLGDRVAAGAAIHPGNLVSEHPGSPHRHLDHVSAELYFGIADQDTMATPDQMAELEAALKARKASYQLEWHPGALHGFMMPSRSELYNEAAAERVWNRMKDLFARTL